MIECNKKKNLRIVRWIFVHSNHGMHGQDCIITDAVYDDGLVMNRIILVTNIVTIVRNRVEIRRWRKRKTFYHVIIIIIVIRRQNIPILI